MLRNITFLIFRKVSSTSMFSQVLRSFATF